MTIQRRNFLKVASLTGVSSVFINSLSAASNDGSTSILLDAVSFKDKGGWKVDPQFIEQMGSPYLLAHGMGIPVANAKTTFTASEAGDYQLWVRTKDWCPGAWEAPGRFQLMVNGKLVETLFGTEAGWNWQKGIKLPLKSGENKIELVDLTGFEGRCDAIYFTKNEADTPPSELKELRIWRDKKHGVKAPDKGEYDLVIAGAGIAGCGAALAAAEKGLKVALISNRPVLGGNSSSEIRVHTLGIHGKVSRILKKIDTKHWRNGSKEAYADEKKRHENMDNEENISIFYDYSVDTVNMQDGMIASLEARSNVSPKRVIISGKQYIDSTGDGLVGQKAGATSRYGREAKDEFNEAWDKHGDLWSPKVKDKRTMGTTVMWNSMKSDKAETFPATPWAKDVAKSYAEPTSEWYWEYTSNDKHQIHDAEDIRDHMFRAVYGNFSNVKMNPLNAKYKLEWVAYIGGKRESRRLLGDYIYTMSDITNSTYFEDTVVEEEREIDAHYQKALKGYVVDFISKAIFYRLKKHYYIPFRSLYSKEIPNLMMAGRCFSCSHIGLCGPRVMNTTGQMGIACGYAATLCVKHNTNPRGVYQKHIKELRTLIGFTKDEA